jgi:hypothetical protein
VEASKTIIRNTTKPPIATRIKQVFADCCISRGAKIGNTTLHRKEQFIRQVHGLLTGGRGQVYRSFHHKIAEVVGMLETTLLIPQTAEKSRIYQMGYRNQPCTCRTYKSSKSANK